MNSSEATSQDTTIGKLLAQVTEIDAAIKAKEEEIKQLGKRRESLAALAVEEMTANRLDGVRAAGRSWRIEFEHSVSATVASTEDVLAAARAVGKGDTLLSVNTSRLKALLKEMATAAGRDARQPWAEGTPFAGLVSEYVRPVLRHLTVG